MRNSNFTILFIIATLFTQSNFAQDNSKTLLFAGSYTDNVPGEAIHVFEFNSENGTLKEINKVDDVVNASYLAVANGGKYLYSVTESKLATNGSVSAFAIDNETGALNFLNKQTTSGRNPAHINIHDSDKYIVSANYSDAVVNLYESNSDGSLKPSDQFIELKGSSILLPNQEQAHAHSSNFSPDNKYLYVMDLGSDKINAYKFNPKKTTKLKFKSSKTFKSIPGSGPRHFAFHPNGKYGYSVNELNGTVSSFAYKSGKLMRIDNDFSYKNKQEGYGGADIHVSKDGKFLYASNRGENTLSIFEIKNDGSLALVGHESTYGDHPRSFVIDPTNKFLLVANQISGNIVVFKRDINSGKLTKLDSEIQLKAPASLKMKAY
ncbi:lactonase family protein [Aurantibacter crassamenti]|uniref:lactonase family protein n=1 Tax=Aurantibacter crassamenti TaxID=1837375 RepID=UPI00193A4C6D|nr:lactonase family protein [Aurantibacter crassamenti]MBM1107286.1 lactonase family protein [Aurantibacter crassamenti]